MWAGLLESRDLLMCSGIKHNHPKKKKKKTTEVLPSALGLAGGFEKFREKMIKIRKECED